MAKNAHLIEVRFVSYTDTKGSRVRLLSHRFARDSVTDGWDFKTYSVFGQAKEMLETLGYTIECKGEARHGYFFVVSEFIPLRDAAARLRANHKAR